MLFRRMVIWLVIVLGMALVQPAHAQDTGLTVRTISFVSMAYGMRLSPDGHTLAVFENGLARENKVDPKFLPIHLINIDTGNEIAQLSSGITDYTSDVAFTRDGRRLASYQVNGQLAIWDVRTAKVVKRFTTSLLAYHRLRFLPDGKLLAVLESGTPSKILLVDTNTGFITRILAPAFKTFADFQQNFTQVPGMMDVQYAGFDVAPNGKTLAVSTFNDEVQLWDIASGKITTLRPASEKKGQIGIRRLAFTPDSKSLIFYDPDVLKIRFMNVADQKESKAVAVGSLAPDMYGLSLDGNTVAWVSKDRANVLQLTKAAEPDKPRPLVEIQGSLKALPALTPPIIFMPDGKRIIFGGFFAQDTRNLIYVIKLG
jgi:WD40 repeat protein